MCDINLGGNFILIFLVGNLKKKKKKVIDKDHVLCSFEYILQNKRVSDRAGGTEELKMMEQTDHAMIKIGSC